MEDKAFDKYYKKPELTFVLPKAVPLPRLLCLPQLSLRPFSYKGSRHWTSGPLGSPRTTHRDSHIHRFPGLHHGPTIWGAGYHSTDLISLLHFSCFLKLNLYLKLGTPILLMMVTPQYQETLWKGGVPRKGNPCLVGDPSAPLTVSNERGCERRCPLHIPQRPAPRTHLLMPIGTKPPAHKAPARPTSFIFKTCTHVTLVR